MNIYKYIQIYNSKHEHTFIINPIIIITETGQQKYYEKKRDNKKIKWTRMITFVRFVIFFCSNSIDSTNVCVCVCVHHDHKLLFLIIHHHVCVYTCHILVIHTQTIFFLIFFCFIFSILFVWLFVCLLARDDSENSYGIVIYSNE